MTSSLSYSSFFEGCRYGFQGQEKDDEIKGAGNSVNYTYRMHDPRLGRFLSLDPLTRKYPYYSPYAFSGNRVIDARELEGLEPATCAVNYGQNLIFGNETLVNSCYGSSVAINTNWHAHRAKNIFDVELEVSNYKKIGVQVQNLVIIGHGGQGVGIDIGMFKGDDATDMAGTTFEGGFKLSAIDICQYMEYKNLSSDSERELYLGGISDWSFVEKIALIESLENVISFIEDGGTLILLHCYAGDGEAGDELIIALSYLSNHRVNIILNQDLTLGPGEVGSSGNGQFLDRPVAGKYQETGIKTIGVDPSPVEATSPQEGIQLNSGGEQPTSQTKIQ